MPRHKSPVRRGLTDQRDRGRRKKHHKGRPVDGGELRHRTTSENWEAKLQFFEAWLEETYRVNDELTIGPPASINLTQYLQSTPTIDIAPDEKLRQLAIFLEPVCEQMNQPSGWHCLRRIYREALKYDHKWPYLWHSMSLSALGCAKMMDEDDPLREEILNESLQFCREGIAINPDFDSLHCSLGNTLYEFRRTAEALAAYQKAVELNSKHVWAALYKAHCLHDLERWSEAIEAYEAVDISQFDGIKSWRGVLLRDQIASCRLHAGDVDQALEDFQAALHRYEHNPGLLYSPQYLKEAADGILGPQIGSRVARLLKAEGW